MVDREIRWGLLLFLAPIAVFFSWIGLGALWMMRRSFTGELVGASDDEVTIAADTGVVTVAYDDIHRSNLIEE